MTHPKWNGNPTDSHDFALVKIQPVTLPNLQTIALNKNKKIPAVNDPVRTVGYGRTGPSYPGTTPAVMLDGTKNAISNSACEAAFADPPGSYSINGIACTVTYKSPPIALGSGDSGGPAFVASVPPLLLGANSFGPGKHSCPAFASGHNCSCPLEFFYSPFDYSQ